MDIQHTLSELQATMAEILQPELRLYNAPTVYVVDVSGDDSLLGFQSCALCHALRDQIGDGWQGAGPAIAINVDAVLKRYHFDDAGLAAVACHEAAHIFDDLHAGKLFDQHPKPTQTLQAVHQFAGTPCEPSDAECLILHDAQFRRVALHLAYRMVQAGWTVPLPWLFESETDSQWDYFHGLEGELNSSDPISEILATDPPEAFNAAWRKDLDSLKGQ